MEELKISKRDLIESLEFVRECIGDFYTEGENKNRLNPALKPWAGQIKAMDKTLYDILKLLKE
jgi:hypothetical protein